jgi:sRNA-binding regulator protein Hfq
MGHLAGLREHLKSVLGHSVFDELLTSQAVWEMRLHGQRVVQAKVVDNQTYELGLDIDGQGREPLHKLQVKCLYPVDSAAEVEKQLKIDKKVLGLGLEPIKAPGQRYIVKNKTLFPLMKEREVVFCTLMEGEVLRGLIADFSRFEMIMHAKGGLPIVILRHSIYDLRTKKGRCMLRSFQDQHRDWQKSALFVS